MGIVTMILGRSGTGKSASIENLDPGSTAIINVLGKALPFRGYRSKYSKLSREELKGNIVHTDKASHIIAAIDHIDRLRPEIKVLILDDIHYVMSNKYFAESLVQGFTKFAVMGKEMVDILQRLQQTREDLYCFLMWHPETDVDGNVKCKTIGKMVDEKDTPEGRCVMQLHTYVSEGQYHFVTNHFGNLPAKSPKGMFDLKIPNDLKLVVERMDEYFGEEL